MPNLRDIKRRIRSVKNTGKITRAMQLVAASKMKKAQDSAVQGRPYAQLMAEIIRQLQHSARDRDIKHPLLRQREVEHRGVLVVSTDKGLLGGLNANLFRKLVDETDRENTRFVTIGRKASQFLARTHRQNLGNFEVSDYARFPEVRPAIEMLLTAYKDGEVDTIEVLYTQFINNLKQVPALVKVGPIDNIDEIVATIEEVEDYTQDAPILTDEREFKFEPGATEILEPLIDLFVKRSIYHMVLEAKASEHSARMVAMKTATDNANELVDKLSLQYNKARQAAITQEILEISAAALN